MDTLVDGEVNGDVDERKADVGAGAPHGLCHVVLQVENPGAEHVAGMLSTVLIGAEEYGVVDLRPGVAERGHRVEHRGVTAAGLGTEDDPGVGDDVGDGLVSDQQVMVASGAEQGGELGGEQVDLRDEVEPALISGASPRTPSRRGRQSPR